MAAKRARSPLHAAAGIASILFLLLVWELASRNISPIILPSPGAVLGSLVALSAEPGFWEAVAGSLLRALTGFGIALAGGVAIGLLSGLSSLARSFFFAPLLLARSTPVIALVLVIFLAVGAEAAPVFSSVLMCLPLIAESVAAGVRSADPALVEMADVYCVGRLARVRDIYAPSALPFLLSGAVSALGLSWKVTIAAEVLSRPVKAIGSSLADAKGMVETAEVYAWTLMALILSVITDRLFALLRGRMGKSAHPA